MDREVLYPEITVEICSEADALSAERAMELLKWEDEDAYGARITIENPKASPLLDEFILKDELGKKVQCWNNIGNRPFSIEWSRQLAQDILTRNWKFNLETIIISMTGLILSGQHRLIALVLAWQIWSSKDKGAFWRRYWKEPPKIDVLIAFGASEDKDVIGTLDNVKPRTLSDVMYTSDLFNQLPNKARAECSRMLEKAVDTSWTRVEAGKGEIHYQSHSASMDFLERHPKLRNCVKHIFDENKQRGIAVMKLSPGMCAAVTYLMAASNDDRKAYQAANPPSEKNLKLDDWQKALAFWTDLIAKRKGLEVVRDALGELRDEETGGEGRAIEKFAVIAMAWRAYMTGRVVTAEDVDTSDCYQKDAERVDQMIECPTFLGIDCGVKLKGIVVELTAEEIEAAKKTEDAKKGRDRAVELDKKAKVAVPADPVRAAHEARKQRYPGRLLVIRLPAGGYSLFGEDAAAAAKCLGIDLIKVKKDSFDRLLLSEMEWPMKSEKLLSAGLKVSVLETARTGAGSSEEEKLRDLFLEKKGSLLSRLKLKK